MRILIGILISALLVGALIWFGWVWGHPIWNPTTSGSAAVPTLTEPDTPVTTPKSTETPSNTPKEASTPTAEQPATPVSQTNAHDVQTKPDTLQPGPASKSNATEHAVAQTTNQAPLTIAEFQSMWSATPIDNPGPLMRKLDAWYDTQATRALNWQYGFQSEVGGWTAIPGSIVWTDTKDLWFTTVNGSALDAGDVVRLRCQGNWCVYAVYRKVTVPTPGRMLILDRWLNPEADLPGWK